MDSKEIAEFFKVLSHPTRVKIVEELLKKRKCVNAIEELLSLKQSNISQHLNLLRLSGVVDYEQEGNRKCYFLTDPDLVRDLLELFNTRR
jgi:ArsR family transcriptional regulator